MHVRTDIQSGAACYISQYGDSLTTIAQKFYGPSATYDDAMKIYYSNTAALNYNPNYVYPGTRLYIPD